MQTDGAVNGVLSQMALMIYDDSGGLESGVSQTVQANWMVQAAEVKVAFPPTGTPAEKRSVATQYAVILERRDASEITLVTLKASLLELGAAHSRAAAGGPMDMSALIANLREQTAFLKDLLTDLKPAKS